MERIASVLAPGLAREDDLEGTRRLAVALLSASPRVMVVSPGLCRVDARGWDRRGGEEALGEALLEAAADGISGGGGGSAGAGIADVAVAADAAARLAAPGGVRIVAPGEARAFLAPLSLELLPLPGEFRETLRALGLRRVGELASLERSELEARFGARGLRAHRRARGEDDRLFRPLAPDEPPEAEMELEGPARAVEPLLFVLRHLLHRLCGELAGKGRAVGRLRLVLVLEGEEERELGVTPARSTRDETLLLELCRAGLERTAEKGRLPRPVTALRLAAVERAPPRVRQEELFEKASRDPAAAAGVLARIRARLGRSAVVRPSPRPGHRPEARSAWEPVTLDPTGTREAVDGEGAPRREEAPGGEEAPEGVLRLLPDPRPVGVRRRDGRPVAVEDERGRHEVLAAEGPERLSGDWWTAPYRREYFRICTDRGELLWIYREPRRGDDRWWLHGWWD